MRGIFDIYSKWRNILHRSKEPEREYRFITEDGEFTVKKGSAPGEVTVYYYTSDGPKKNVLYAPITSTWKGVLIGSEVLITWDKDVIPPLIVNGKQIL